MYEKFSPEEVEGIIAYIDANDTIEGAPVLKDEHLSVFDCAFKPRNGERSLKKTAVIEGQQCA